MISHHHLTMNRQYDIYLFSRYRYKLTTFSLQRGPVAAGEGHAGDLVVLVRHQHPHLRQLVQVLHAVAQGLLKLELAEITLKGA